MLKQVDSMPKSGRFAVVYENAETPLARNMLRTNEYVWFTDELWRTVGEVMRADEVFKDDSCKFFIQVPEFRKLQFSKTWQVLKWLEKNGGVSLYPEPKLGTFVEYVGMEYWRSNNGQASPMLSSRSLVTKLTWYVRNEDKS